MFNMCDIFLQTKRFKFRLIWKNLTQITCLYLISDIQAFFKCQIKCH
jgi:hypothetical protein